MRHATGRVHRPRAGSHGREAGREQVEDVLAALLRTLTAQDGREEAQGLFERAGRPMLLRVIVERGVVATVITVIATSRIDKYGGAA